MRLRVLGCSGGIGGRHLRTTSFLVDSDIPVSYTHLTLPTNREV